MFEGEEMAMRIAERIVTITENRTKSAYVFKGSYRKANRFPSPIPSDRHR